MAKNKRTKIISFVVDSKEIRAVELCGTPAAPTLSTFGGIALSEGMIVDGVIQNVPAVASRLTQLLNDCHFTAKNVIIGVKNSNVLLRMATFPNLPLDKLKGAVAYQSQQFIPIPVSELILDFVVCGENTSSERPMLNVLLVGAKKNYINALIEAVDIAGLKIKEIDAAMLAVCRGVIASCTPQDNSFLLANIDSEMTNIAIITNGIIMMTRSIMLSSELSDILNENTNGTLSDEGCKNAAKALQDDIIASINYFTSQNNVTIGTAYLTGQFPSLKDIAYEVQELTGLTVTSPQLYTQFSEIDTMAYSDCISLALRGLEG
ncbi:MAG: pilus assembly protein PilM [Oscillospiraceae bacterium]